MHIAAKAGLATASAVVGGASMYGGMKVDDSSGETFNTWTDMSTGTKIAMGGSGAIFAAGLMAGGPGSNFATGIVLAGLGGVAAGALLGTTLLD